VALLPFPRHLRCPSSTPGTEVDRVEPLAPVEEGSVAHGYPMPSLLVLSLTSALVRTV
jgi:hypothetical protein